MFVGEAENHWIYSLPLEGNIPAVHQVAEWETRHLWALMSPWCWSDRLWTHPTPWLVVLWENKHHIVYAFLVRSSVICCQKHPEFHTSRSKDNTKEWLVIQGNANRWAAVRGPDLAWVQKGSLECMYIRKDDIRGRDTINTKLMHWHLPWRPPRSSQEVSCLREPGLSNKGPIT